MAVADSVVLLGYALFADDLARHRQDTSRAAVLDSLIRADKQHEQTFEAFAVPRAVASQARGQDAGLVTFFSAPRENTLSAAVFAPYKAGATFREVSEFNTGMLFLFFFDSDGIITLVLHKTLQFE